MPPISVELIRAKSEHHGGLLSDLEELSLHQLNIEKIDFLSQACPKLKILYLQNNLISKIENLRRLKQLCYINLALNNLTSIEGLDSCEKLTKLDLTVNFIATEQLESSLLHLVPLYNLRELYLTGNPCTLFPSYRSFVIVSLPQLTKLDGTDISRTEQLEAKQNQNKIKQELQQFIEENRDKDQTKQFTPQERLKQHREAEEIERKKAEEKKLGQESNIKDDWKAAQERLNEKVIISGENSAERPSQRNTGKYSFTLNEINNGHDYELIVKVPKYLDSELIDVDLHANWLQVIIKGKNLLLHLAEDINISTSKVQRISNTGNLRVLMPILSGKLNSKTPNLVFDGSHNSAQRDSDEEDEAAEETQSNPISVTINKAKALSNGNNNGSNSGSGNAKRGGGFINSVTSSRSYRSIVPDNPSALENSTNLRQISSNVSSTLEEQRKRERQTNQAEEAEKVSKKLAELGLDDSDVPPLE
jgi:protein TilB